MGLKAMAFALVLQFSTNWAMKTYTMAAGQFAEFILTRESSEHRMMMWIIEIQV